MFNFISYCLAYGAGPQAGAAGKQGNALGGLIPIILIFVIFYFLLIRPQRKQQKDHATMIANLRKNDEVITSGGIYGTIVAVKDDTFVLRIADNVKIEVQKSYITALLKRHS